NAINVYPNPTDGLLTIEGLTQETSLNYTIYSMDGDLLEQNSLDFSKTIDINQLASGMYVLQLNFPDGFSKRISITKK
ncbi:MAG: T9SS type A sorting domain-containing protein, partial [Crocinitomicaceae bacterium]|nr:T9SS type A sorting domain-containing protein [Crocinitomicaceae bacterium]